MHQLEDVRTTRETGSDGGPQIKSNCQNVKHDIAWC